MNKSKARILSIFVVLLVMLASNCMATELRKNGYDIDVFWKQSGKKLKVWGDVGRGRSCRQLNLSIIFSNSNDSGSAHLEAAIQNYSPKSRNTYKAYETVYLKKYRKHWHVESVDTECLQ